jgi:phosphopantetheinyl transferase
MEERSHKKKRANPGYLSFRQIRFMRDLDQQLTSLIEYLDLFFQVITLAESFSKLVGNLSSVARDSTLNIRNLSLEFTAAFNGLRDFLNDLRSGKEDQPTVETNNLPNRETAIAYIVQCLRSNTYVNVIKYLRSAR